MKKFLLMCFSFGFALSVWAQDRVVTGKVTSAEDGSALPGVNVIVKGTTRGSVTDSNGQYSVTVSASGANLVFSFIGLTTQEIEIGERSVVDIQLGLDIKQLSEVVVTGVGVATDKKRLGISVESISSDKLPTIPTSSIDQALVGKIAGAQIFSTSGAPGSQVSIQLRGINTLSGGTQPLIMVDGIEMASTTLNQLDLNNVDKIEVVQGAAAATIYGAQGANGVIQIFTKKGKEGPAQVQVSSRVSFDTPLNVGNLHQPYNNSFQTDTNGNVLDNNSALLSQDPSTSLWGQPSWLTGPNATNTNKYSNNTQYYDHVKQLFQKTARTENYSATISGGTAKTDYSLSVSKNIQESIIYGSNTRNNLTLNVGSEIFKNFKFRFINQVIYTDNTVVPGSGISSALYTYPFASFKSEDPGGNFLFKLGGAGANSTNPLYQFRYQHYDTKTIDIIPTINLSYKVNKFIDLDYKFGINFSSINYNRYTENQSLFPSVQSTGIYLGQSINGDISESATRKTNQNSLATAVLHFDFAKDFGWNLPIISTTQFKFDWRKYRTDYQTMNFVGLPTYTPVNGGQASVNNASEYSDEFITYGYLFNEKLEYKNLIGVSGGSRSDYSSVFGQAKTPFTFPRFDGYLRVSEFGFWNSLRGVISDFKLRGAYGQAGIQPVNYFGATGVTLPNHYLRLVTLNSGAYTNGNYLNINSVSSNTKLNVENSIEKEYGFDLGLTPNSGGNFFSYIGLNFTAWQRQGKNVVWPQALAPSSGLSQIYTNYVGLSSNGIQFTLDAQIYDTPTFGWELVTTFGHTLSKLDNTLDGKSIPLPYSGGGTYTLTPGQPIGTLYGYKAITNLSQKDPSGNFYIDQTKLANYEIVNGIVVNTATRGAQFTSDKYNLGNTQPMFNASFTNTFHYKNYLNFSFQVDWIYKQVTYNSTKEWMYSEGLHGDYDKAVKIGGETKPFTAYYKSFYDASESNGTKDYFLESSSFVRLRNVNVAFDLAKVFKMPFKKCQIILTGRNLLTITKYTGFDPEANVNTSGGGTGSAAGQIATQRGLDLWAFPNFKSYQVGINFGL